VALFSVILAASSVSGCGDAGGGAGEGHGSAAEPQQSGYTATRYPIVLIPGFLGFTKLLGTVEYFAGVADALEQSGAHAYQVNVSQAGSSYVRGEEIIPQLDALRIVTGATKFNLVGHSQGAIDARYIAAVRPDLVASITSVAAPHGGTPVAANIGAFPLGLGDVGVGALGDFFKLLSGSSQPNDGKAVLDFLAPSGMMPFNTKYPAGLPTEECGQGPASANGIAMYSWGGIGWLTNPLDIIDPVWILLGGQIPEANDGLVPRCGSHFGQVIRDDYPYNHIDSSNMVFGLVLPFAPNPKELYRAHANRLMNAGL
jgi:triacylglycerol lipase